MGRIHLLKDDVIDKIAAGEVVERPASVVKELVENAIDAGATDIRIELEEGGIKRISVTDNGSGMSADDALMAIRRHATSKINSADDLFSIGTMGFRGEALASIAAVSRFTILTREQGASEGLKLTVDDGGEATTQPWSGASGTTITVADLFYNVPVRRGFLKTAQSEFAQCHELLQAMALALPTVGFTLLHNGREHLRVAALEPNFEAHWHTERALRQRAADTLGDKTVEGMIYVQRSSKYGHVEALVSPPGLEKGSGKFLFTFVNGRWVKDKLLRYGVLRGYHSHLLKGKFPVVVVHMTLDPSLVDVNAHPAKTEVRFQYGNEVQSLISLAIREGIRDGSWASAGGASQVIERHEPSFDTKASVPPPVLAPKDFDLAFSPSGRSERSPGYGGSTPPREPKPRDMTVTRTKVSFDGDEPAATWGLKAQAGRAFSTARDYSADLGGPASPATSSGDLSTPMQVTTTREGEEAIPWHELDFIGAFGKCYLFFEHQDKLLVLDQHAFHERVLFERLSRDRSQLGRQQPLLMPEAIELAPSQVASLGERRALIAELGFDFTQLDERTIEVCAVPALMQNRDLEALITALAEPHEQDRPGEESPSGIAQDILATMACHAAVRAGEELGEAELKFLLREADTVDFYHNCPHGRRVFRWWKKSQVAGWFDR